MSVTLIESGQSKDSLLHSYCVNPDIKFGTQHNDEEVLLLLRAHPITFVPMIATALFLLIIPFLVNVFLVKILSIEELIFTNFVWFSFIFTYVFMTIVTWLFNVGLVTDERVLDMDYSNILHSQPTSTSIEDITDVTAKTTGFIRSLFRYGDVFVQTAGTEQNIDFLAVPNPEDVVSIINRLMR